MYTCRYLSRRIYILYHSIKNKNHAIYYVWFTLYSGDRESRAYETLTDR